MRAVGLFAIVAVGACARVAPAPSVEAKAASSASVVPSVSQGVASASALPSASASVAPIPEPRLTVQLVPLGDVPVDAVAEAAAGLRAQVATLDVSITARSKLPQEAMSSEKGRYRADALLRFLEKHPAAAVKGKLMGITDVDIVAEKNGIQNWGVIGLGSIDGKSCVVSTYRLERKFEKGGGAPPALVRERLWKVTLHELGHTLGLPHCPNKGCIMEDAHGTVKTVDTEKSLCDDCKTRFFDAIKAMN